MSATTCLAALATIFLVTGALAELSDLVDDLHRWQASRTNVGRTTADRQH